MKKLLVAGNRFVKGMDLTEVALLKICVGALGILVGLGATKRHRSRLGFFAVFAFVATCFPLLKKFCYLLTTPEEK